MSNELKFNEAFNKIFKKDKLNPTDNSKTVMEEQYGFTIDSTVIKEILSDNYTSYTFLIKREIEDDSFFENLIVSIDSTAIPEAYIIKYTLNSEPIYINEDDAYSLDAQIELTEIDYNDTQTKVSYTDSEGCVVTLMCPYPYDGSAHAAGANCIAADRGDVYWSTPYCSTSSSGGGGFGDGGSPLGGDGPSSGGGGGSSGTPPDNDYDPTDPNNHGNGGNPPILTDPVIDEEIEQPDPCDDLKQLSNTDDQNINNDIQFLKDKLTNGTNTEWGIRMKREQNQDGSHTQNNIQVQGGANGVNMIKGWDWIGGAHLHTSNGYEMFSWSDVYDLAGFHTSASADNQQFIVAMLVTHNPEYANDPTTNQYNVYAIKADNVNTLINKVNNFWNSPFFSQYAEVNRMGEILKWQQKKFKENKNNLEKYFLQFHNNYGISLYKANNDLSNWNKLTLNGTVVEETPCN